MQQFKSLKILCFITILSCTVSANALIVTNTDGNIRGHYGKSYNKSMYPYIKTHSINTQNSLMRQPKVAKSSITEINGVGLGKYDSNRVYILKKKQKSSFGGSQHQDQMLKQYMGKEY